MKSNKQDLSKWPRRLGTMLGTLVTLAFLFSAATKLAHVDKFVEKLTRAGIPDGAIVPIGILELTCLGLYWLPRTSILGTFLLSGYIGGAIVTHIIGRENFAPPLIVGLWMFISAYLRHAELRKLIPLRSTETEGTYDATLRSQPVRG